MEPIEIVINGTDKGFLKTLQQAVRAENEMKEGLEKIKKKSDETAGSLGKMGAAGQQSFGSQALSQLSSFASGFASVQGIVDLVSSSLTKMRADVDAAVSSFAKLRDQRKEMAQLATDPQDYYRLKRRAGELSTTYGLPQEESHLLTNAARAGGFEGSLDQVAMAAATFANSDDLAQTAAILPTIFPGLTPEQAINLAAAGGTEAKAMTFKGISNEMRIAAQGASTAGSGAVETGALVTILSDKFGTSTGDRIRAFGGKVGLDKELAGKGIMGAFDALQSMPEAQRKNFLKDTAEINQVYNELLNRGGDVRAMEKLLGERMAATGTAASPLAVGARSFLQDEENRAQFNADVAKQISEQSNQDRNLVYGLKAQAALDMERAKFGSTPFVGTMVEASGFLPGTGNVPDFAQRAGATVNRQAPIVPEIVIPSPLQGAAKDLHDAAAALKRSAEQVQQSRHDAANRERMGNRE